LPAYGCSYHIHMKVFYDIPSTRKAIKSIRQANKSIGLVATMGSLHDGHLSLITASKKNNDITVATIFVNPIQFNNPDDLKNYPSSLADDLEFLEKYHCDIVFIPSAADMYPKEPVIKFDFGGLDNTMEGSFRPGHFSGVALVVMKLFQILLPTRAYFGQKDLQQFAILEKMQFDCSLDVELIMMPIIREDSGLALSSRNTRLSEKGKAIAPQIFIALNLVATTLKNGSTIKDAIAQAHAHLATYQEIKIEYIKLVNLKDLRIVETSNGNDPLALCFAGYVENIRLIDNLVING